jgi:hypothetical protein
MIIVGVLLLGLALLFGFHPRALATPVVVVFVWISMALFYRAFKLYRKRKRSIG